MAGVLPLPPPPAVVPDADKAASLKRKFFSSRVDFTDRIQNNPTDAAPKRRRPNITPSINSIKCKMVDEEQKSEPQVIRLSDRSLTSIALKAATAITDEPFTGKPQGKLVKHVPLMLDTTGHQPYPERWDKACWWDCSTFTTKPVGCPIRYDALRNIMYLHGFFCSWNCARAYGDVYMSSHIRPFIGMWIMKITKALAKQAHTEIDWEHYGVPPAPHWSLLERFSPKGLTIDEFRSLHCKGTRTVTVPDHLALFPCGVNVYEIPFRPAVSSQRTSAAAVKTEAKMSAPDEKKATECPPQLKPLVAHSEKAKKHRKPPARKPKGKAHEGGEDAKAKSEEPERPATPISHDPAKQHYWKKRNHTDSVKQWQMERQKPPRESTLMKFMGIQTKPKGGA